MSETPEGAAGSQMISPLIAHPRPTPESHSSRCRLVQREWRSPVSGRLSVPSCGPGPSNAPLMLTRHALGLEMVRSEYARALSSSENMVASMVGTEASVVVPCRNEAANIRAVIDAIVHSMTPVGPFEIIVVDDGSDDGMADLLDAALREIPMLRVLRHDRPAGQSAAIHSGVLAARHGLICTLDGDGQNPPEELARLVVRSLKTVRTAWGWSRGSGSGARIRWRAGLPRALQTACGQ